MTETIAAQIEEKTKSSLRKWDLLLLPALGLLTVGVIACSAELVARYLFPSTNNVESGRCMVVNNPTFGGKGIPNCVYLEQMGEGGVTEYRFNSHGHRTGMEYGPKAPGVYRVVMVGTSFATGLRVPVEQTFASLLPIELSRRTGRKVELYNEAIPTKLPFFIARDFYEVLDPKPDLILWVITRGDVQTLPSASENPPLKPTVSKNWFEKIWRKINPKYGSEPLAKGIGDLLGNSRAAFMLRHELFQSQSQYVRSYLIGEDSEMGYLRAHPSAEWQARLRQFDQDTAELQGKAEAAGVPIVSVFLPRGPQAAMISMKDWPPEDDPYKLDEEIRKIVIAHGGEYIDILPDFRNLPNPEKYFFPVEGHPNAQGHQLLTQMLAEQLTDGVVPALKAPASSQIVAGGGR